MKKEKMYAIFGQYPPKHAKSHKIPYHFFKINISKGIDQNSFRSVYTPFGMVFFAFTLFFSLIFTTESQAGIVEQGCDCGTNCCYTIDDKGNLVLSIAEGASKANIKERAFENKHLKSVSIPEGFTYIGTYGLSGNDFKSVQLPSSLTTVGTDAFNGNYSLSQITLPNVKNISPWAFSSNRSLHSIELPDSLEEIGFGAFRYSGLTSLTIPDSVKTTGFRIFEGCTSLSEIIISEDTDTTNWNDSTFLSAPENLTIYCQGTVENCQNKLAKYIPDASGKCAAKTRNGVSNCLKNATFVPAEDERCDSTKYYYNGSECIKEPDAAMRVCDYEGSGYIKVGNYCASPSVTYAKKRYTPAEANQWLKDDNNTVTITFKK